MPQGALFDVHRASCALAFQLPSKALPCRRNWRLYARNTGCQPWLCWTATAVVVRLLRLHHRRQENIHSSAHRAGVTIADGWRYPLQAESHAAYLNLRLFDYAHEIARASAARLHVLSEEVAEGSGGLICLTGGEEGPLAHALARGGTAAGMECACAAALADAFSAGTMSDAVELQRHLLPRGGSAQSGHAAPEIARKLSLPLLATNGVRHARPQQS